jgi:hypothetical protein
LNDIALGPEVLFLLLINAKDALSRVDEATLLPALRIDDAFQAWPPSLSANAHAAFPPPSKPTATASVIPHSLAGSVTTEAGAIRDDAWSVADRTFDSLEAVSDATQLVWLQHDGLPRLYPAAQFAPKKEPFTDVSLFMKFLTAPSMRVGVHGGGLVRHGARQDAFVSHMVRQMSYHHNGTGPHDVTHNLTLLLDKSDGFFIPHLAEQPVPEEEEDCEVFWVLRGGRTNAHIGKMTIDG